jgi:hypothetical protein
VDFANWCDSEGFTYNHPGDNATNVFEKVKEILAAGRGSWSFNA